MYASVSMFIGIIVALLIFCIAGIVSTFLLLRLRGNEVKVAKEETVLVMKQKKDLENQLLSLSELLDNQQRKIERLQNVVNYYEGKSKSKDAA